MSFKMRERRASLVTEFGIFGFGVWANMVRGTACREATLCPFVFLSDIDVFVCPIECPLEKDAGVVAEDI